MLFQSIAVVRGTPTAYLGLAREKVGGESSGKGGREWWRLVSSLLEQLNREQEHQELHGRRAYTAESTTYRFEVFATFMSPTMPRKKNNAQLRVRRRENDSSCLPVLPLQLPPVLLADIHVLLH